MGLLTQSRDLQKYFAMGILFGRLFSKPIMLKALRSLEVSRT